jgi:hypothetical protein
MQIMLKEEEEEKKEKKEEKKNKRYKSYFSVLFSKVNMKFSVCIIN